MIDLIKAASIMALVIALVNLVLFATGKINALVFWMIIILLAIFAFPVLKWMKK